MGNIPLWLCIPFAGLLLCIAILPLVKGEWWEKNRPWAVIAWSLLFIIPGIVKHYSYCMTRFIVMEYPEIPVTKALRISKVITYGHRMDIFIMELSFLGWSLLCLLTCGIGFFWLNPYMQLSLTNAYHSILTEAIETGKLKKEDLAGEK